MIVNYRLGLPSTRRLQRGQLTPTFISIVPQRTSIVEFLVLAIVMICTMRIIEQTVVKIPSVKTPMRAILRRVLICNCSRTGIGRRKITQSKKMVTPDKA